MDRFEILRTLGRVLMPEYRFEWPGHDWWQVAQFHRYLERFGEPEGLNAGRRWNMLELTRLAAAVPGDTAECGVFQGAGSYLICQAMARQGRFVRAHHVFDSFRGLSDPGAHDGSHWHRGDLAEELARVRENLREFENLTLYPGWIPTRFDEVADRRFAFVHVDVDLYAPTLKSIEFFHPRLNPGGILVCDDYGYATCPGATRAVDEFLADKDEKMIGLASGGGFLIKGTPTAPPLYA